MKVLVVFAILMCSVFSICANHSAVAETGTSVSGHIISRQDGESVPFINVLIEGTRIGAITSVSGYYMLANLPEGLHTLTVMGMGYNTERVEFEIKTGQNLVINLDIEYLGLNLDEIVITSSPVGKGFRYQPDNVYTGEQLQRRSEISFGGMLDGEPGIAMRSMGPTPSRPVIRGLDGDRILILQNGERMGDISETSAGHAISLDPLSSSRVEVVRGPASLLYGSSAIGGVINLMTNDIPEGWDQGASGVVSLQGASMNQMGAGFGRYAYGSEKWAAGGRFGYRKAGDVRTPDGIIPGTFTENYDGSVGIGFDNKQVSGGFNLSMGSQNYGIPEELDDPLASVEVRIRQQMMQGRMNFGVNNFFDKAQLRVHASRFIQQEMELEIEDGIIHEEIEVQFNKFNVSSTLTVQHKPVGILDRGAVGISLYARKLDIDGAYGFTPNEERFNVGMFTFQEIPLTTKVRMQFGGRLDFQRATAIPNDFLQSDHSRYAFVYSGSMGLNYRPAEGYEIGGQFARSHRHPMLEELFASGAHLCAGRFEIGDIDLGDEIGYGSDLFARWSNGSFRTELAVFYNYFSNFIIMQPTGSIDEESGFPVIEYQQDKARLYGGEAIFGWEILKGLTTDLTVDYVVGQRTGLLRDNLPFMPPFRFSGSVEYDYGKGWIGTRVRAIASQERIAVEEDTTPGYTLLGINSGLRLNGSGNHVIIIRVENLLNIKYRDHLTRIEERNFPMPGRNLNLAYRWFF
jgi:iron complex outermembrane recepter protein